MRGCVDALGISESAFTLVRDLIEQRLGVFYDNGKRDLLADRLSQVTAAHGMQSFLDYYYALKYDADADRYWSELMDYLTVPETYFWRQPDHFTALVEQVVPAHIASRPDQPLRIWCSACCSGEEPLSIVMALHESGAFDKIQVDLLASDASPAMVQKAERGLYGERAFRNLPAHMRDRWFTQESATQWRVSPALKERIRYRVINFVNEVEAQEGAGVDVIFCRNALIYFSDEAIARAAAILSRCLRPGGRLFLGAAETLTRVKSNFVLTELGEVLVYVNQR